MRANSRLRMRSITARSVTRRAENRAHGEVIVPMPVWPYLWERPFVGILEAVEGVSHYEWHGTVLFNGRDVPSTAVPWTYVPLWLLATTPPSFNVKSGIGLTSRTGLR